MKATFETLKTVAQNLIKGLPRSSLVPLDQQGTLGGTLHQPITTDMSLKSIRGTKAHVTIYTKGPVTDATAAGNAAMVATVRDPADPVIIHTSKLRRAEVSSSYLSTGHWPNAPLGVLLNAIQSGTRDTWHIRQRLNNRECPTILSWVPSDKYYRAANEFKTAAAVETTVTPSKYISFTTARALIHRPIADSPPNRPQNGHGVRTCHLKADCIAT